MAPFLRILVLLAIAGAARLLAWPVGAVDAEVREIPIEGADGRRLVATAYVPRGHPLAAGGGAVTGAGAPAGAEAGEPRGAGTAGAAAGWRARGVSVPAVVLCHGVAASRRHMDPLARAPRRRGRHGHVPPLRGPRPRRRRERGARGPAIRARARRALGGRAARRVLGDVRARGRGLRRGAPRARRRVPRGGARDSLARRGPGTGRGGRPRLHCRALARPAAPRGLPPLRRAGRPRGRGGAPRTRARPSPRPPRRRAGRPRPPPRRAGAGDRAAHPLGVAPRARPRPAPPRPGGRRAPLPRPGRRPRPPRGGRALERCRPSPRPRGDPRCALHRGDLARRLRRLDRRHGHRRPPRAPRAPRPRARPAALPLAGGRPAAPLHPRDARGEARPRVARAALEHGRDRRRRDRRARPRARVPPRHGPAARARARRARDDPRSPGPGRRRPLAAASPAAAQRAHAASRARLAAILFVLLAGAGALLHKRAAEGLLSGEGSLGTVAMAGVRLLVLPVVAAWLGLAGLRLLERIRGRPIGAARDRREVQIGST